MKRAATVLHVLEATEGGTRRWVERMLPLLHSDDCRQTLACSLRRDPAFRSRVDTLRRVGIEVAEIDMERRIAPWSDARALAQLHALLRCLRPGLVHAHSSKAGILARLAARLLPKPIPVVYTPHAFAFLRGGWQGGVARWGERMLLPLTSRLLAVSKAEAEAAYGVGYSAAQVTVARNAPERTMQKSDYVLSKDAVWVGTLSRLHSQKDPLCFVDMCSRLAKSHPQTHYIICGRGPLERKTRDRAIAHGLERSFTVAYLGDDASAYLKGLSVYVSTSRYEGLSYSLLEAMEQGRPIVATRVAGNEETIVDGESGLLVPPRDPEAAASAVARLLDAPEWAARLGAQAQARVRTMFRIEEQVECVRAVYADVLATR